MQATYSEAAPDASALSAQQIQAENRRVALEWAARGYRIFPADSNKKPLIKDWQSKATCDPVAINAQWRAIPGRATGNPVRNTQWKAVLDIDRKNGKDGFAGLSALGHDPEMLSPYRVRTPSGGLHHCFAWPKGLRNFTDYPCKGVDGRGDGGFVIAGGAVLPDGRRYVVEGEPLPHSVMGMPPDWPAEFTPPKREPKAHASADLIVSISMVRSALAAIPNDGDDFGDRDAWRDIGMAVHHVPGGRWSALRRGMPGPHSGTKIQPRGHG